MKTISIRLKDGDDLYSSILDICKSNNIEAGVVLSAVGSLKRTNIRMPVIEGKVDMLNLENVEIDALQGTVSKNGCHLHIVVSDKSGAAYGGHLKSNNPVRTTCELVIGLLNETRFDRQPDPKTGYDELEISWYKSW